MRKNPGWDHPRSRGVYQVLCRGRRWWVGSSPLARGLQDLQRCERAPGGIIPARAGFTFSHLFPYPHAWDHPRSRGVYSTGCALIWPRCGSSPLARGLLCVYAPAARRRGIIPARAGFTYTVECIMSYLRDHPRSRGVYEGRRGGRRKFRGSSPLARGLPVGQGPSQRWDRIIPARAGFTPQRDYGRRPRRDHPRSRGVYRVSWCGDAFAAGSSPLARGLPLADRLRALVLGIIPARAGFTFISVPLGWLVPDHPRSRGVYALRAAAFGYRTGSSPLARGLLKGRTGPIS